MLAIYGKLRPNFGFFLLKFYAYITTKRAKEICKSTLMKTFVPNIFAIMHWDRRFTAQWLIKIINASSVNEFVILIANKHENKTAKNSRKLREPLIFQ